MGPGPLPVVQPIQFQKAMVFIDGTNLFHRLDAAKLNLNQNLSQLLTAFLGRRQIVRIYLYTIEEHLNKAKTFHGNHITEGIRVVFGEGIPTKDGNIKEKGVDALLVADLIYHAAVKNYDYALVVSTDTDFVKALRRVEDFGCRTGVLAVCSDVPDRLREACDEPKSCSKHQMLQWAVRRT
ncbi:MAG: hypothetical protein AUG51_07065 [Acidobacteria bacterium 13_1_20CM_3_53_8]|nr:MAG: hypothetical protein AUG51_07065 [Acidobacteria bacterium 13_1_20CM_3_53_8]